MKIWLIADTHFGHDKMIEYCGRPKGFEKLILENLNKMVQHEDMLIHLGDFCISGDAKWHKEFYWNLPVNCKKWLIKGNHDTKSNTWYLRNGWDFVCAKFQDKFFGKNILFSHTPQRQKKVVESMYISGHFDLNIHGHFHNNLHRLQEGRYVVKGEKERNKIDLANLTEKHKLLAIENINYQPIILKTFIKKELKEKD